MENESQHHYVLRSGSRSRSQTPSVQTKSMIQPEPERHYDLRSRSRERSGTPSELGSAKKSTSRPGSTVKSQDSGMETITEKKEEQEREADNQSAKSEGSIVGEPVPAKKPERRSERQRAKRQIFANGQSDTKDDSMIGRGDQKRKSASPRRILTSDYSSEEGERDDPPSRPGSAYEIYKRAGEWWNVFPKTDYTYSERSQCRYEIAPGVLAMPNMSRRPIHSDGSSTLSSGASTSQQNLSQDSQTNTESGLGDAIDVTDTKERTQSRTSQSMDDSYASLFDTKPRNWDAGARSTVYKKTHVEQYRSHREVIYSEPGSPIGVRQRHGSRLGTPLRSGESHHGYKLTTQVDSDTELDDAVVVSTKTTGHRWTIVRWFSSIATVLYLWSSRALEFLHAGGSAHRYNTYDYHRYQESRWTRLWRHVTNFLQYTYLFLVRTFCFDSWLLSRLTGPRGWVRDRSSKLAWLALLPLLLLTGWLCLVYLPLTFTGDQTKAAAPRFSRSDGKEETLLLDSRSLERDELTAIIGKLTEKIARLENEAIRQTERLSNVSRLVEKAKDDDPLNVYNDKVVLFEKRSDNERSSDSGLRDIEALRLELVTLKELYTQLKSCCDSCTTFVTNESVDRRIEEAVSGYLGAGVSKAEFSRAVRNLIFTNARGRTSEEGDNGDLAGIVGASEDRVREIVREALRIYDADKTGRVDYALESAGGQIISTRCTQRYDVRTRAIKFLAFMYYDENNNPRTVIQGNPIQPGACWAFQGFPGYLLIKLRSFIHVTGFTMEHASKSILPNGEMKSAPRKFNVWGYKDEDDSDPVLFGDYEFPASDENLQYFPVQNTEITRPYEYVELRVHSNHGQLEYTCLYRFRVHGKPA